MIVLEVFLTAMIVNKESYNSTNPWNKFFLTAMIVLKVFLTAMIVNKESTQRTSP